ncbi:hypothetical protein EVAR_74958_1 [Eumeta japonica]|uniref:Uncharacterized protein n=1 Tax=Eumeta variegata TaxID=151549 RepID=A0A4C1UJQ7_EUMVA|nr:hypothetical protein EVAR_74958_1 [Eumeta japonica]
MATTTNSTKTNMQANSHSSSTDEVHSYRLIEMSLILDGILPTEHKFLMIMNREVLLDIIWEDQSNLMLQKLPINLNNPNIASSLIDTPIVLLLRTISKSTKEYDPLLHPDNRAGANIDLLPVVLGEETYSIRVNLISLDTGLRTGCSVEIFFETSNSMENRIPLLVTMINASCLPPPPKDDTCYIAAMDFEGLCEPSTVSFGLAASTYDAERIKWTSIDMLGNICNSDYFCTREDFYTPPNIDVNTEKDKCKCEYWNNCRRLLIDSSKLLDRLKSPFFVEIAGIPKKGKIEAREHYMGYADMEVLQQPGEYSVTVCAKLSFFDESELPEHITTLLNLPSVKSKGIPIRESNSVFDLFGHTSYVTIRFDLFEPLVPKLRNSKLYEILGLISCTDEWELIDDFEEVPVEKDRTIDTKRIRTGCDALAVHSELCGITALNSTLNQTTKGTAANRLQTRIKTMLKEFYPGDCNYLDWQDIIRSQHSASRRAVTASFAPQPPQQQLPSLFAAARARLMCDHRIVNIHTKTMLDAAPNHPRSLLINVLRNLELFEIQTPLKIINSFLQIQKNRYLLWILGALEFDQRSEENDRSFAAFQISVEKQVNSEALCNVLGWAALHVLHHFNGNHQAAFVAAKKMRKFFELPCDWNGFIRRWYIKSGEEECLWNPNLIATKSPFLIASAFFLCLRTYTFSAQLLECYEMGCDKKGSRLEWTLPDQIDKCYLQAASLLLRNHAQDALLHVEECIMNNGPVAKLCQMRAMCLVQMRGWDEECRIAFDTAVKEEAEPSSALLLRAASELLNINFHIALQYAAAAHKMTPCGHSAFIIARIYNKFGEDKLAKRWASAAVRLEMLLSDAWALLAIIAIRENQHDQALALLRTARQAGPINFEIAQEIKNLIALIPSKSTSELLFKNVCLCHYE